MNPLAFMTNKVWGALLGASLLVNVLLYFGMSFYHSKYNECHSAVLAAKTIAVEHKKVVEEKEKEVVHESSNRIRTRIAAATQRLHDEGRGTNLPDTAGTPAGTLPEGGASVVLPRGQYEADKLTCTVNTILAEEWQKFYTGVKSANDGKSISYTGSGDFSGDAGRPLPRIVHGLGWYLDMELGRYQRFWTSGVPTVRKQSPVVGRRPESGDLVATEDVSSSGPSGIRQAVDTQRDGGGAFVSLEYRMHRKDTVAEAPSEGGRSLPEDALP